MSWLRCCLASLSLLVVCCSQGISFSLTECNAQHNFDIVENHETSMTCTGLYWGHHVHWNITGPAANSVETTVARCGKCTVLPCDGVCSSSNPNYEIYRNFRSTTLQFKNNLNVNNGAVVKCSDAEKTRQASCTINVIKAYKLDNCVNNKVDVIASEGTSIRCSGLDSSQNMYWKATDLYGRSVDIAQCGSCTSAGYCPTCWVPNTHFQVTRSREFSVLQIVSQAIQKNRWTLICSKKDNAAKDQCEIHIKYHMTQCHNGILQIRETQPQRPILCDGLASEENMNWTITDHNGPPFEIATCLDRKRNYRCESTDADFSSARTVPVSQLVMKNYARDKVVNKTLTCIRRDGARRDSCRIRVVYPAEISKRSVTLNGWTVAGTAMIDKVFDSDKDVVCVWNMTGPNSIRILQYQRPNFSPFVEEADSPIYYHGACSVSIPVNATEGVYRLFLTVMPAGGTVAVGNVTLKKPGELLRLPACPQYISEGSNLECTCRHVSSLQGSPPARVTWLYHDATSVLGTNHDDASVLRVSNVRREQNGTTYTCRSVWGPNNDVTRTSDYTLRVAYKLQNEGNGADGALGLVVVGSITPVVVVAALVVVVIIVVFRRKGSSKPASTKHSDEFEEYINEIYESTDDVEPTNLLRQNLSENNATHPPQNSTPHHNAEEATTREDATCSINTAREDATCNINTAREDATWNINTAMVQANPSPRNDVYAEVVKKPRGATLKTKSKETQAIPDVTYAEVQKRPKGENSPTQAKSPEVVKKPKGAALKTKSKETQALPNETYAEVQKKAKGQNSPTQAKSPEVVKKPKGAALKTKSKETQAIPDETYAEVQKKPKREHSRVHAKSSVKKVRKEDDRKSETSTGQDVTAKGMPERESEEVTEYANCPPESTGENSEDVYMNVGKSSPLTLTESNTEVTTEAATDDEYNQLSFARPQTEGNEDHYNHLDGL